MPGDAVLLWLQPRDGMQNPGHPGTDFWRHRADSRRDWIGRRGLHHPQGHFKYLLHPRLCHATVWCLVREIHEIFHTVQIQNSYLMGIFPEAQTTRTSYF